MRTVLLLAGTAEARAFAVAFDYPGTRLVASLAGATEIPCSYPCETRSGGFGGAEGLRDWLKAEKSVAVIDATHPFASVISRNAVEACAAEGVPLLTLVRPPWSPVGNWQSFPTLDHAVAALPAGARVLAATGAKHTAPLFQRRDTTIFLRMINSLSGLPSHIVPLRTRGPFAVEAEIALMRKHAITHLLTRNSGGASRERIDAAVALDLSIYVMERRAHSVGHVVETVADALYWLDTMLDH